MLRVESFRILDSKTLILGPDNEEIIIDNYLLNTLKTIWKH